MENNVKEIEVVNEVVENTTRDDQYVIDKDGFLVKKSLWLEDRKAG